MPRVTTKRLLALALGLLLIVGLSLFPAFKVVETECGDTGYARGTSSCALPPKGTKITQYGLPLQAGWSYRGNPINDTCGKDPLAGACRSMADMLDQNNSFSVQNFSINVATWLIVLGATYSLIRQQNKRKKRKNK